MTPRARAWLREPLLHFVAIGAALFALDRALGASTTPKPDGRPGRIAVAEGPIVLDAKVREGLSEDFRRTRGREATDEELAAMTEHWKDQEVLYRAGVANGLDRDDPQVRDRIAAKMAAVVEGEVLVREPTEAEARAYYEEHGERWAKAELYDFTQVFVKGSDDDARARADGLLEELRGGADPSGKGDTFQGGRRYRGRKLEDLAKQFGEPFADGLKTQSEGAWQELSSKFGFHLVRLDRRTGAQKESFESARLDVEKAWRDRERAEGARRKMEELRSRWPIVEEP